MTIHSIKAGLSWAFMIESDSALFLVDAGTPGYEKNLLDVIEGSGGKELRFILITHAHFDHYGCAKRLREITGSQILIHEADREALESGETCLGNVRGRGRLIRPLLPLVELYYRPEGIIPDQEVNDGDRLDSFGLKSKILHTPGHTPGSCTLLLDGGDAFAGDLVSTTGRPHVQRYFANDWDMVRESVRRLKYERPERVFAGHGGRPMSAEELAGI